MAKTLQEQNFEDLTTCGEQQVFLEECEECDDCTSRGLDLIIESLGDIKHSVIELYNEIKIRIDGLEVQINHFRQQLKDIWIYISKLKNGAPEGGYEGQVLTKDSDLDYDYSWHTLPCPFPIGSLYMNIVNIDPHNYWLDSYWVRVAKGRTLVGVDESNSLFDSPEETGGDYDSQPIIHNHGFTNPTISLDGKHDHTLRASGGGEAIASRDFVGSTLGLSNIQADFLTWVSGEDVSGGGIGTHSYVSLQSSGGQDVVAKTAHTTYYGKYEDYGNDIKHRHGFDDVGEVHYEGISGTNENIQPYLTTYIWKRVPQEEYEEWLQQNNKQKKTSKKK